MDIGSPPGPDSEDHELQDDNVYVQELKKVFDDCADDAGQLTPISLGHLCSKLHLSDHYDYISGQVLPLDDSTINFPDFKRKFIQILPEIVNFDDLSSPVETHEEGKSPAESQRRLRKVPKIFKN